MEKEILDKAYKEIHGCLKQMEFLVKRIKDAHNFYLKNNYYSDEHQISFAEMARTDDLCYKSFIRHLALYPELRDEWIVTNIGELKMTFIEGLEIHFSEKKSLLQNIAFQLSNNDNVVETNKTKTVNQYYYGNIYNVENAEIVGENNQLIKINDLDSSTMVQLTEQLEKLIHYTRTEYVNEEGVKNLSAAKEELVKGNDKQFKDFLKKAGKWTLDASTKIGTGLITAYLKNIYGL